jgi:hypothetical protein
MADDTLTDRWLRRLKNNPVVAAAIVLGVTLAGLFTFWSQVPREVRDWFGDRLPSKGETVEAPAMGWAFAGYVDRNDEFRWASPARVRLVEASGATDREHIFRVGDVVRPLEPVHQVIADYRTAGTLHQMEAPWMVTEEIRKKEDWTGRVYDTRTDLEVLDVSVSQYPGLDFAVWLRVQPIDRDE